MKIQDHKKALKLSLFTVFYNILEGLAAVSFGIAGGSSALLGFGLDSFAESLSGGIMVWRFAKHHPKKKEERMEKRAYVLVGYSFLALGAYVLYEALAHLIDGQAPEHSAAGIVIAVISLLIMPLLFRSKYKLGKEIKSRSLVADSKQTVACMMMSIVLLAGAGLNYISDIWWADPAAGIIIAMLLLKEGLEMQRGHSHH